MPPKEVCSFTTRSTHPCFLHSILAHLSCTAQTPPCDVAVLAFAHHADGSTNALTRSRRSMQMHPPLPLRLLAASYTACWLAPATAPPPAAPLLAPAHCPRAFTPAVPPCLYPSPAVFVL
ncbi:hypothetical protein B0H12DRAFT_1151395 [Mycena haematopus]|nr:hypothetical protein B0H12DRAFT_1151395 [Mycena haematopus]